jgi:F0F1-type ATP synthase assembly protein I
MQKVLESITEIFGWIQIVFSPTIIGVGLGFIIYSHFQNTTGLIFGIIISLIGFIIGIVLANKKYKTTGTVRFLSRISATPEIDSESEIKSKKR